MMNAGVGVAGEVGTPGGRGKTIQSLKRTQGPAKFTCVCVCVCYYVATNVICILSLIYTQTIMSYM